MKQVVPLVDKYRIPEKFDRQKMDIQEINSAIQKGMALGYEELLSTYKESIERTNYLFKVAQKSFKQNTFDLQVENKTLKLKITLESILFSSQVYFSLIRERKDAFISVSVSDHFKRLNTEPIRIYLRELSTQQNNIFYYKTNYTLLEESFQDGEILLMEFYLNDDLYEERNKVFETILTGDVTTWIGVHAPSVNELSKQNLAVNLSLSITEA